MHGQVGQNRGLIFALAASLALHALVFLAGSERRPPARPPEPSPGPIEARLAEPTPPAVEPAVRPEKSKPVVKSETKPAAVAAEAPEAIPEPSNAPAAQRGMAAADPGTLGQYRLQLIAAARRYKRYPPLAQENNWEGKVLIGVAIAANGRAGPACVARQGIRFRSAGGVRPRGLSREKAAQKQKLVSHHGSRAPATENGVDALAACAFMM